MEEKFRPRISREPLDVPSIRVGSCRAMHEHVLTHYRAPCAPRTLCRRMFEPRESSWYIDAAGMMAYEPDERECPTCLERMKAMAKKALEEAQALEAVPCEQCKHLAYRTFPDHWPTDWCSKYCRAVQKDERRQCIRRPACVKQNGGERTDG